jgi:hypothetical protein
MCQPALARCSSLASCRFARPTPLTSPSVAVYVRLRLGQFAFPCNAFMLLICIFDAIFELAPIMWELFGHFVNPARHIATDCGPEGHGFTDTSKFEFVINLQTARTLGLTIPPSCARRKRNPTSSARACARYGVLVVGEEMKGL